MGNKKKKNTEMEVASWFINLAGIFGHEYFFLYDTWRKIEGFHETDKAEIIAAFLHHWFHDRFGYSTRPVGISWFSECSEQEHNDYISRYMPVIKAYENSKQ